MTGPAELVVRLVMCLLPVAVFASDGRAMAVATTVFLALSDGYLRLWCFTSRSLVADGDGLEITSGFSKRAVRWDDVLAIQTWHHFNRVEYMAVHYACAGRVDVATCASRYAEDELRAFVRACAARVSSSSPRLFVVTAGLFERSCCHPLLKRLVQDVAVATLAGVLLGVAGQSFILGLLAASLSGLVAAVRQPIRTIRLVQKNGLWSFERHVGRESRAIPRSLRLWLQCLTEGL